MATVERASFLTPEFTGRLAVTLGALALYRLGSHLPLAGIDQAALAELYRGDRSSLAIERISIFALGVMPIITALLLIEALRLASRRFDNWASATPANTRVVDRYALAVALLLSAVQGYGLAGALEGMRNLVPEPGSEFRLGTVATFVAATALLTWLATMITRHGLGSGLWILLLVPFLASLPRLAVSIYDAVQTGTLSRASVAATLVILLMMLAAVVALARALATARMPLERTLIWPLFMAPVVISFLALIAWVLPADPMRDGGGSTLYLAALLCIVIAVSLAQWMRVAGRAGPDGTPVRNTGAGDLALMTLTALTLAAITIMPDLVAAQFDVPPLIDGRTLIVAVAAALGMQSLVLPAREPR